MDKKKILIVSASFYPQNSPRSFRTTELAKELSRQGHDVTVYIPAKGNDYTSFGTEYGLKIKNLGDLKWKEIDLTGGIIERLIRRAINRALRVLFEWPDIELLFKVSNVLKNEQGYDLLISIAVPHPIHWGVARIWKKKKNIAKTWIADCGDSYMFARLDTFKKMFYFKYFEKSFCSRCDYIAVPFDAMHTQFYKEFRSKIITIPQGFNLAEIKRSDKPVHHEKPTFLFAGSIIPGFRDLTLLLDFLRDYKNDFLFIVYTNEQGWFEKHKSELKNRIEIRSYIDRLTLIYEMSKVDFLVNVDTILDSQSNVEAIPSKLIDYALSGRPILNLNSNNLDVEKVKAFLSGDYSGARVIDTSRYDIKIVAKKFTRLQITE